MRKPYGAEEWDGYPMPNVSPNKKPLSKEEEDRIIAELRKRAGKRLAEQNQKPADDKKAV